MKSDFLGGLAFVFSVMFVVFVIALAGSDIGSRRAHAAAIKAGVAHYVVDAKTGVTRFEYIPCQCGAECPCPQ